VSVTQTVTGVSDSNSFRAVFTAAVLSVLPVDSTVVINSVTATLARRSRLLLQQQTPRGGVVVGYTVKAPHTSPATVQSALQNPASVAAVNNVVQRTFPTASVAPPASFSNNNAPVPPPTGVSATATIALSVVFSVLGGCLLLGLLISWCTVSYENHWTYRWGWAAKKEQEERETSQQLSLGEIYPSPGSNRTASPGYAASAASAAGLGPEVMAVSQKAPDGTPGRYFVRPRQQTPFSAGDEMYQLERGYQGQGRQSPVPFSPAPGGGFLSPRTPIDYTQRRTPAAAAAAAAAVSPPRPPPAGSAPPQSLVTGLKAAAAAQQQRKAALAAASAAKEKERRPDELMPPMPPPPPPGPVEVTVTSPGRTAAPRPAGAPPSTSPSPFFTFDKVFEEEKEFRTDNPLPNRPRYAGPLLPSPPPPPPPPLGNDLIPSAATTPALSPPTRGAGGGVGGGGRGPPPPPTPPPRAVAEAAMAIFEGEVSMNKPGMRKR